MTKRVSVVPVIVTGTRGTTGTPDVDVDEVELVDVELDELDEVVAEPPVDVEGPLEQAEKAAATGAPKAATHSTRRSTIDGSNMAGKLAF